MGSARSLWIIGIGILSLIAAAGGLRIPASGIGVHPVYGAETPAVDYDAIEAFLKKATAKQPVANLTLIRQAQPSPIPGMLQVKFMVEMNGQRQHGLVYVSGTRIILGQIFDLSTQLNLTAQEAGDSEPVHYDIKTLDLNDRPPRGNPAGQLVIVEFSDFQCPFCKQASGPLTELLKKHPRDVALYYKHFPLSQIHPLAYKMALASECGRVQKAEAFWTFHDHFFTDPPIHDAAQLREQIRQWSDQQGLETNKFLTCYDNGEQSPRIEKDLADARKIGATATPTFLFNGEYVSGTQSLEMLEAFLKAK